MDKSPEYVNMCEKATEIQAEAPFTMDGSGRPFRVATDFWETRQGEMIGLLSPWESGGTFPITWLPRQDDLQEMWGETLPEMLPWFYNFARNNAPGQFSSMEQLWLTFVMHEKYGERWDAKKKDWVKE